MPPSPQRLVLGSASPRRRELLSHLGLDFELREPRGVDESKVRETSAVGVCRELAERKARWVAESEGVAADGSAATWVLGSDTVVALGDEGPDEAIIGKPRDREHARDILARLAGRTHRVASGVAVAGPAGALSSGVEVTEVVFRDLTPGEIDAYLATGDWEGKAGAYGIQSEGASLVRGFRGCWYNVVGLPLTLTASLLAPAFAIDWTCDCPSMPLALPPVPACGAAASIR